MDWGELGELGELDELDELGWIGVNWVNWGGRVNRGSTWLGVLEVRSMCGLFIGRRVNGCDVWMGGMCE